MGEGVAGEIQEPVPPLRRGFCAARSPTFHLSGNPPRKGSNCRAMSEVPESNVGAGRRERKEVGALPGSSSASCSSPANLFFSARASSRPLTPLRTPVQGGTRFPVTPGFSDLLNPFRPSAASPRPQPQPHPERLWDAGRGTGRQRNGMVNNRLWMARAPVLCVPLRTPDRQPHEAHRGGDQPGVDAVAVQGEAGGRRERHPVLRHPDRDLRGGGRGHHVEGQEGETEGRIELQVEGPHGRGIADHLIEAAGFLDRPRRGREACTLDIDLARLRPLPEVAEAESILTEPVVWAWSVPRKSETRKRAARSGEGTRKALWRRPFRAERRFWTSSRVLSWIEDRESITPWPRARSSSRFPTIWERLPWSPSTKGFLSLAPPGSARRGCSDCMLFN